MENKFCYSKYACLDQDALKLRSENKDFRSVYSRDADKILFSLSYSRYIDKTQVFSFQENDHITKRIIHVSLVSRIARTIGRNLGLNEDLIEAISLGHDIGHVPLGHLGEKFLNEISLKYLNERFLHNVQSVRNFLNIEKDGLGCNLSIQVLDGILCHNGEKILKEYHYHPKTIQDFFSDYEKCYQEKQLLTDIVPMTLEGAVVRISDVIGYLGRGLEDAIILGILKKEDIPKEIKNNLGEDNKTIIDKAVADIITNSQDKNYITMSENMYNSLNLLMKFNYKNIYNKANSREKVEKYQEMFNTVFEENLKYLQNKDYSKDIYQIFLKNMHKTYLKETKDMRIVIDYIAGMTDDFFFREYKKIINKNV